MVATIGNEAQLLICSIVNEFDAACCVTGAGATITAATIINARDARRICMTILLQARLIARIESQSCFRWQVGGR